MKTIKPLFLVLLALSLTFSCNKEEDDDDNNNNQNNTSNSTMNAEVNGNDWSGSMSTQASYDSEVLSVTGSNASTQQLQVVIQNITATGTYELGGNSPGNTGRWTIGTGQNDTYSTMFGGSGQVEVTALSASGAEGNFSFTALNSNGDDVDVTEGTFDVEF